MAEEHLGFWKEGVALNFRMGWRSGRNIEKGGIKLFLNLDILNIIEIKNILGKIVLLNLLR